MNIQQLSILQHTLGVDEFGQGVQYRNHFCAGGDDETVCNELVILGYMDTYEKISFIPYTTYYVTDSGKKAMSEESPKPPKLTRSQKRYRRYLDADTDYTFGQWIKYYESGNNHVL